MPTVSRRVVVRGRVQGVFFRDTCRRQARDLGVSGWVRNTWAGDVEARFEGSEGAVGRLVDWCHRGPSGAVVTGVEVEDLPPEGFDGFIVR